MAGALDRGKRGDTTLFWRQPGRRSDTDFTRQLSQLPAMVTPVLLFEYAGPWTFNSTRDTPAWQNGFSRKGRHPERVQSVNSIDAWRQSCEFGVPSSLPPSWRSAPLVRSEAEGPVLAAKPRNRLLAALATGCHQSWNQTYFALPGESYTYSLIIRSCGDFRARGLLAVWSRVPPAPGGRQGPIACRTFLGRRGQGSLTHAQRYVSACPRARRRQPGTPVSAGENVTIDTRYIGPTRANSGRGDDARSLASPAAQTRNDDTRLAPIVITSTVVSDIAHHTSRDFVHRESSLDARLSAATQRYAQARA